MRSGPAWGAPPPALLHSAATARHPCCWQAKLGAHAQAGFTSFDTADIYRDSESLLGQWAAARRAAQGGGAPPVQLLTKFVPNIFNSAPTSASVEAAIRRSCRALQVDSLDLVQLHWW